MLKNHAHPFPKLVDIRLRIRDILSVYDNPAFSNFLKLVQAAKEGGFPTAGRADNDNNFTLVDFCGNALKYFQMAKILFQVFHFDLYIIWIHTSASFPVPWQPTAEAGSQSGTSQRRFPKSERKGMWRPPHFLQC